MANGRGILLMTNESQTSTAVAAALESNGKLAPENVCRDFTELSDRLSGTSRSVVLVDIDTPGTLSSLDAFSRRFADARFVVLSEGMDNQRLLEAMHIGARHYLLKRSIPTELRSVLDRISPPNADRAAGQVYTVLSAGGGCGATTFAINLANELRLSPDQHTRALVVDLDTVYGAVGSYLGIHAEYGVADLLARTGPIDGHLVETSAVRCTNGLNALLSVATRRLGDPVVLDAHRLSAAVLTCAETFDVTVVDAPRVGPTLAAELVRVSQETFLLLQPTVKDVHAARRMLPFLTAAGAVTTLLSRYRRRWSSIGIDDARDALGVAELMTLPTDYASAAESLNTGKPLSDTSPRSDLRREIKNIAARLMAANHSKQAPVRAGR